ncbi:MAG: UPF0079 ATP-binding protein [bacterium P3]|nr:MAG: UPF0079 ATP-binding protein [bacterium P3]KWW42661.1 MAG: UPF0079 ATP-binding protein [bacterium F083]
MNGLLIENYVESELSHVANRLRAAFPDERFFALFGSMGAGKTALVKAFCRCLGVEDNVCSPTFSIVNEYTAATGDPVYHFDFYRLRHIDEAYDIGYDEYFYSGNYCFVEWPELVEPLLPQRYVKIHISGEDDRRTLDASIIETEN